MSTYKTTKGVTIDLDAIRDLNKNTSAAGNIRMNANGDELGAGGAIARPARTIAQDAHKVSKEVRSVGLKGSKDEISVSSATPANKKEETSPKVKEKSKKKPKEIELEDGSIEIVETDDEV